MKNILDMVRDREAVIGIPREILLNHSLGSNDKIVGSIVCAECMNNGGYCFMSYSDIRKYTGISYNSIINALDKLSKLGMLDILSKGRIHVLKWKY